MKDYQKIAWWNLNKFCNFNCDYCFSPKEFRENIIYNGKEDKLDTIVEFFDKTGFTWLINMSGGEPFLYPNFIDLCKKLTNKHYISINTNLSNNQINHFCKKINPEKVEFINCSFHYLERKKRGLIKEFIDRVNLLKRNDFNIYVTQVMWPPIIDQFDEIIELFKKENINVLPEFFRGNYNKKVYPNSYVKSEKEEILDYLHRIDFKNVLRNHGKYAERWAKTIAGLPTFKGLDCGAGFDSIYIEFDGTIKRCSSENTKLGNLFSQKCQLLNRPSKCNSKFCECPIEGIMSAFGNPKIKRRIFINFLQNEF
jgi:MoaA/NifB/PqqE/SkfB family radical SAM enzyme